MRLALLIGLVMLSAAPAFAHHSGAMYESTKPITLRGTVTEFRWTNPHCILMLTTEAKAGETPVVWTIELTSPGNLTRIGWTRTSIKANDRLDLVIAPLRDGGHGGGFRKATILTTGQVLSGGAGDAIHAGETPNLK